MFYVRKNKKTIFTVGATGVLLIMSLLSAWLTHVITTIHLEQYVLLLVGAIMFPVGIIHGIGIWFGIF